MTDITVTITTPLSIRRFGLPLIRFPGLAIGKSLEALSRLMGDAFCMAYVDPYCSATRQQRLVPDENLEGRDPNW